MYEEYQVRVYQDSVQWFQNGKLHRIDGPAIERANGSKKWYQNGKLHREDGPAFEWSTGGKSWYQNGKLHRLDGPAIEGSGKSNYWYIEGVEYTEEEFNKKIAEMNASAASSKLTCAGKEVEIDGKTYILTLKE